MRIATVFTLALCLGLGACGDDKKPTPEEQQAKAINEAFGGKLPMNEDEARKLGQEMAKKMLENMGKVELTDAKMESFFEFYEQFKDAKGDPAKAMAILSKTKDWSIVTMPRWPSSSPGSRPM